jgi:hypothetical protein
MGVDGRGADWTGKAGNGAAEAERLVAARNAIGADRKGRSGTAWIVLYAKGAEPKG